MPVANVNVVMDETHTLNNDGVLLMQEIRDCVDAAARLRSAAPLQLVAWCLRYGRTSDVLGIEDFVAVNHLDERLEHALLTAGVVPTQPLPKDAPLRVAAAILGETYEGAAAPLTPAPAAAAAGSAEVRTLQLELKALQATLARGNEELMTKEAGWREERSALRAEVARLQQRQGAQGSSLQAELARLQQEVLTNAAAAEQLQLMQAEAARRQKELLAKEAAWRDERAALEAELDRLRALATRATSGGGGGGEAARLAAEVARLQRELARAEAEARRAADERDAEAATRARLEAQLGEEAARAARELSELSGQLQAERDAARDERQRAAAEAAGAAAERKARLELGAECDELRARLAAAAAAAAAAAVPAPAFAPAAAAAPSAGMPTAALTAAELEAIRRAAHEARARGGDARDDARGDEPAAAAEARGAAAALAASGGPLEAAVVASGGAAVLAGALRRPLREAVGGHVSAAHERAFLSALARHGDEALLRKLLRLASDGAAAPYAAPDEAARLLWAWLARGGHGHGLPPTPAPQPTPTPTPAPTTPAAGPGGVPGGETFSFDPSLVERDDGDADGLRLCVRHARTGAAFVVAKRRSNRHLVFSDGAGPLRFEFQPGADAALTWKRSSPPLVLGGSAAAGTDNGAMGAAGAAGAACAYTVAAWVSWAPDFLSDGRAPRTVLGAAASTGGRPIAHVDGTLGVWSGSDAADAGFGAGAGFGAVQPAAGRSSAWPAAFRPCVGADGAPFRMSGSDGWRLVIATGTRGGGGGGGGGGVTRFYVGDALTAPRAAGVADRACCGQRVEQCGLGAPEAPTGWLGGGWTWDRALSEAERDALHLATSAPYAAAEGPRYAIAEAIGAGLLLHLDPAMAMLETAAAPCATPRGWHVGQNPGRLLRVAAGDADLCCWDLRDPSRPHDLLLSACADGPFAAAPSPSPSPSPSSQPSSQPASMAMATAMAVPREYTMACWVRLAPSGLAPLRCVFRGADDLFLCTLDDQLGVYCGRDPSLRRDERFRPCLDEQRNVVHIDGSLGWTFVAITGRGAAVVGRGGATATSGTQEFFFAQPNTGLVYFGQADRVASGDTLLGFGSAPHADAALRAAPPGLLGQVWCFSRVLSEEELAGLHGTTRYTYAQAMGVEAEAPSLGA